MNDLLINKLISVELNEVPLWEALRFINMHCHEDELEDQILTLRYICERSRRGTMSITEFGELLGK